MLKNTTKRYGKVAVILHWLIALGVLSEIAMGLYMTSLTYYDPMYQPLPHYHESIGILLAVLIIARIIWSMMNPKPAPGKGVSAKEQLVSKIVHYAMNTLLIAIVTLGYLLSTAEGDAIAVFDWFGFPALYAAGDSQANFSAFWHYWLAMIVLGLVVLHALGALKHHFIDKDETLRRMLGQKPR